MTAPSIGIKDLLVSASIGVFNSTGTWIITIGKMSESQDKIITIYDSGGLAPNPKWLLNYPDISIIIRGTAYIDTYNKMVDIKNKLLGLSAQVINSDRWNGVTSIGDINFLGFDEKDRPRFSMTFRIILEPADSAGDNRDPLG